MTHDISQERLSKLREKPLHTHCRSILGKTDRGVGEGTLGAPELMLWGLEQHSLQAEFSEAVQLWGVVEMLQGKPSLADRIVSEAVAGKEESLLRLNDPLELARELLLTFREHMGGFSSGKEG